MLTTLLLPLLSGMGGISSARRPEQEEGSKNQEAGKGESVKLLSKSGRG